MKEHFSSKAWHGEDKCIYCDSGLEIPVSEHEMEIHYKKTICKKCGKKIWFRVNFHGSGHDNLNYSELEQKVV
jgi:uncharacterized protein with PIN domain